uniref:Ubiquitin like 4A n=1 Tax=Rousettus aegyptiacus TaxID=9407 RepID=A0A7J8ENA7_ROUAE|nr:ubiquitin like 4A [Rousettus aegyptiacus]
MKEKQVGESGMNIAQLCGVTSVSASSQAAASGSKVGCLQLPLNPSLTASREHLPARSTFAPHSVASFPDAPSK